MIQRIPIVALMLVACALGSSAQAQEPHAPQERKKRVAVLDFEYGTVRTEVASLFGTDVDVGRGMADLLVKHLVKDGSYAVVERKAVQIILAEQDFTNQGRVDPASAARIGKMLGLDAIILGTITQFGGESGQKSGGAIGVVPGVVGAGGGSKRETKAIVSVDARIVDIDTGEIMAVAEGKGESSRGGKTLFGLGGGGGGFGFGVVDFSSSGFQETIIGEAVKAAVEEISRGVIAANYALAMRPVHVEGVVAFASGSLVVLNVGSKAGLRPGDHLWVERVTQEIHDPTSGELIHRMTAYAGELEVREVDERSAVCEVLEGTAIQVGDLARAVLP